MKYELSANEVQALKAMIDVAIRAQGSKIAETGVVLLKKLDTPLEENPKDDKKN